MARIGLKEGSRRARKAEAQVDSCDRGRRRGQRRWRIGIGICDCDCKTITNLCCRTTPLLLVVVALCYTVYLTHHSQLPRFCALYPYI